MGYLAYGAAAGVGKEYLEQSKETRKRDFTLIRDKRLKEMQGELIDQRQGLMAQREIDSDERLAGREETKAAALKASGDADRKATTDEAQAGRDWDASNYEAPIGTTVTRDGKIVQQGEHRPNAGSTSANLTYQKWMDESVELLNGKRETMGSMRDNWEDVAYEEFDNPEFPGMGLKIKRRNPATKDFPLWLNEQIVKKDHLNINDPKYMQGDPDALFRYAESRPEFNHPRGRENAIASIKNARGADGQPLYPWWTGPAGSQTPANPGTTGPNQGAPSNVPNPMHNEGPDADAEPPPVNAGASTSNGGGMLDQASLQGQKANKLETQVKASRQRQASKKQKRDFVIAKRKEMSLSGGLKAPGNAAKVQEYVARNWNTMQWHEQQMFLDEFGAALPPKQIAQLTSAQTAQR